MYAPVVLQHKASYAKAKYHEEAEQEKPYVQEGIVLLRIIHSIKIFEEQTIGCVP